jgi:hypothetical protein
MKKYLVAGVLIAGFVTPALADGKTMMMMGTAGFKTKSDAQKAMKGMAECKA